MINKKEYRFIISGGGSGGHIYPALSIADGLKNKFINSELLFVGSKNKMEMKIRKKQQKVDSLENKAERLKRQIKSLHKLN